MGKSMNKPGMIFLLMLLTLPAAAGEIRLAKQREGNKLSEEGEPFVRCAMDLLSEMYTITRGPWGRAQRGTEDGIYDGFFMAAKNKKRDAYAISL